jgi:hypothetical protein
MRKNESTNYFFHIFVGNYENTPFSATFIRYKNKEELAFNNY